MHYFMNVIQTSSYYALMFCKLYIRYRSINPPTNEAYQLIGRYTRYSSNTAEYTFSVYNSNYMLMPTDRAKLPHAMSTISRRVPSEITSMQQALRAI